jgi:hypothetical protein
MNNNIDEKEALSHLDQIDRENQVNSQPGSEQNPGQPPQTSLGKSTIVSDSGAGESPWKLLNLNLLPSRGMFYHPNVELLIRSASTREIRHWSTMDEHDPIDIREKINFILNSCTRFKIKGDPRPFNVNDFLDIDRYHILFRIYEMTFPNQENKLFANVKCRNSKCGHTNRIQVTSQNLLGFSIPQDLSRWYSERERCFVIPSEKLGETLRVYLPNIGISNAFRQNRAQDERRGISIDKSFYDNCPYLMFDWRNASPEVLNSVRNDMNNWSTEKFTAIFKITELLKKASTNRVIGSCEKCKSKIESHIFLGGSFTVKDIFIVSARLDEII